MQDTRIAQLSEFLRGQTVCPWARAALSAGRLVFVTQGATPAARQALRVGLQRFAACEGQAGLVYILPLSATESMRTFEGLVRPAYRELYRYALTIEQPKLGRGQRQAIVDREVAMMFDPRCPLRPHLPIGEQPTTSIAMGPVYPTTHPRFAPIACLVVVRQADLAAIPISAKEPSRARAWAAAGGPYDADEMVLPLRQPVPAAASDRP